MVFMFYTDDFMWNVMGITALPPVLYHYTSIETLALILENRSLRFSRLDGVNDPEEASASDLTAASTLVFGSCWTAQDRESIAMWRMYTPDMQGIRIRLPNNPFLGRNTPTVWEKGGATQRVDAGIVINRGNGGLGITTHYVTGPNKIHYTDDKSYLNGTCLVDDDGRRSVQLYDLGMAKNTYWSFEEEWRYKVLATLSEIPLHEPNLQAHPAFDLTNYPVLEEALFVPLAEDCFDEMEVLLGPRVTLGQELIVNALLNKYAKKATLRRSEINVRI